MKADALTMAISREIVAEVKTERKPGSRPNCCHQFFGRVRGVFVFLFVVTVWVCAFHYRSEVQDSVSSKLGPWSQTVSKKSFTSNQIHQNAIAYEKELDEITK